MDESHNVRADKSLRAINSLRPTLGLEFTATPIVRNIIYSFSLSEAIREGIVKRPVVLTRSDDDPAKEERELIKLTDGMRRHERKRSILATYCANRGLQVIIPRVLVSTRDIAECDRIGKLLQAPSFEGGRYDGKVLTIHSGSEDDQIEALLNLERSDRHEIVVHVNKLKEGWDVKTIFTIIPLRASASDILVEQTIGRGLRLPFGHQVSRDPDAPESERDQLREIDTLEIISHDNYSRVIEARKAKGRDWAAIEVKVDTQPPNVERTEVTPDNPPAYTLTIPLIRAEFNTEGKLGLDAIVPNFASLEALSAIIKSVDLENLQERELERVREQVSADPVNYFVSQIIRNSPEFDLRDKATLQKLVKQYIAKLKVDGNLGEVLMSNRGKIITDLIVQIDQRVQDQTRITYHATGEQLRFHSYYKEIEVGQSDLAKDTAGEGVKGRIVSGYEKTAFSRNVFDSLPEKLFADVIDADKQVARWVKPPYRQLTIAYPGGSYTPDFVVQTTQGATFVVEVKQDGELEEAQRAPSTHNVALKYFAACEWCELMRQVAKASWEYRLIPASTISVTKTFSGILAEARSLHR
jgi:superfamily II DNA or RNA helicase